MDWIDFKNGKTRPDNDTWVLIKTSLKWAPKYEVCHLRVTNGICLQMTIRVKKKMLLNGHIYRRIKYSQVAELVDALPE